MMNPHTSFFSRLAAAWKWALSFRKQNWDLNDYPIFVREDESAEQRSTLRMKSHRFTAQIEQWDLSGSGDTKRNALSDLRRTFDAAKAEKQREGRRLPRPGTRVPLEFATRDEVSKHPELEDDFIRRVLQLEWAFISDESSLWHFHTELTNELLISWIKNVYGVDVSDIESARLSEILNRIAVSRKTP
jgi:hypothetical protein